MQNGIAGIPKHALSTIYMTDKRLYELTTFRFRAAGRRAVQMGRNRRSTALALINLAYLLAVDSSL